MDTLEAVKMIAVERGFYKGRMVHPEQSFMFDTVVDGKPRKPPKWAVLASEAKPPKAKAKAGDLKPLEAQAAVKQKAAELSGSE